MAKYKKLGSVTLFDAQNTKEDLSKLGYPLERLSQVVDFEMFRKALEDLWNDNSNKKKQKDIDARWTQKGGQNYFGYKNHIKMDKVSKFIMKCLASAASLHDSQALDYLLDESDQGQSIYADSAYVGQCNILAKWDMIDEICEKGYRNHSLTEEQKESNRKKSSIRSRVEHVFGFMEQTMHGLIFRWVGIVRAKANIAVTNLVYNMCRLGQVVRLHKDWIIAN